MTKAEFSNMMERFAIAVMYTTMSEISDDEKYNLISTGIDTVVDAVMFGNDWKREMATTPSLN